MRSSESDGGAEALPLFSSEAEEKLVERIAELEKDVRIEQLAAERARKDKCEVEARFHGLVAQNLALRLQLDAVRLQLRKEHG